MISGEKERNVKIKKDGVDRERRRKKNEKYVGKKTKKNKKKLQIEI